ncbi:TPA: hypothetical protein HA351_13795 [Methanosarcinaceae archaeon]|nr:hypothetical protein [Methanosarcinaceae archaeon]
MNPLAADEECNKFGPERKSGNNRANGFDARVREADGFEGGESFLHFSTTGYFLEQIGPEQRLCKRL